MVLCPRLEHFVEGDVQLCRNIAAMKASHSGVNRGHIGKRIIEISGTIGG